MRSKLLGYLCYPLLALLLAGQACAQEVRVGLYQNEPKLFTNDAGEADGILIDLLQEIAARENWQLKFVACEWQECLKALEAGAIDLMPDVAYSTERDRQFDFHRTPALHSWSQMYCPQALHLMSRLDLAGKKLVVLEKSVQLDAIKTMLNAYGLEAEVIPAASMDELFRLVQQGRADVAVAGHYFGEFKAHEYGLVATPVVFNPVHLFYATAQARNPDLLAAIDRHLELWLQDSSSPYFSIIKNWGGELHQQEIPSRFWNVLAIITLALLALTVLALFLRWQVQSRTRQLAENNAKLQRMTKLYAALSQCNQAIVRSRDEAELFAIICRDAVNFGGMKMAWIGLLEESGQWVKQVASFGAGIAYLEGLEISLDAESPKGLGPTATAMREDHPFWCQDFQHDPATAAWHERGARFGWAASAALPLHRKGHVIGAFSLYTDVAHAFDEEAQHLLVEMAMDIDFALDHFVDEAQRAVAQQALQEAEEVYRAAFQSSPDTININRLEDGLYLDVNAAFERVSGWMRDEVIGRTSAEINIWHDMADRSRLLEHLQRDGGCENMKAQFAMKDGTLRTCLMSARKITLKGVACILSITRDMSAQEQADARIQQLAHFDQLTGLPNRALLNDRFKYSLSLAQRSGEPLVVMFLDLDHFKTINDTLGHSIGDQLLMEVSRRLKSSLREEDTLSRMGGDEFILVLPGTDEAGARQVAGKLIEAVAHPCQIEQYELVNTISIGIALYPHDGEDFETLSKHADTAMYRVKQASRNDFCFFTQEMQAHSARTLQLLNALRHALARNELALYYQPQIALQDGHIIGAEALLRWTHPELGSISPDEFIPIAEDSGLIIPIGEWVLRSAATQARAWLASGLPPLVVAVNLSAVQFRHPNLTELVNRILAETQLAAEYLELELTEAVAMDDPLAAIAVMNKLHECGIRMSIDDFGTGYSSLSYLKKFQVYKLKIDQSFVRDITDDPDDKAIVSAIINLANSLGMQTIAEGVETSGQLAFLRLQGCDEVQGYYFSKPLPAGEFEQFVKASLSTAAV